MSKPRSNPGAVLAVVGPTATGKTRIGAALAKALGSEVISVDSQQVYAELDIGVAKPTVEEMQGVPHHMIGVVPPTEEFSAGAYAEMATPILHHLQAADKIPVVVGGTGFYLRALLQPNHLPPVAIDSAYREILHELLGQHGAPHLHAMLTERDPNRAGQIHPNDTVRLIRALEIIHQTGETIAPTPETFAYPTTVIGLTYADRELHLQRIRARLAEMVAAGFLDEVSRLYEQYGHCFALENAHGYPELLEVVLGERTLKNALDQIEINIRQYSKRQMTWFRRVPGITWFHVDQDPMDEVMTFVLEQFR